MSFKNQDSADGGVFFALVIIGFLSVGIAAWVELAFAPVWWVHVLIQIPLVIIGTLGVLRVSKSLLIYYQYKYKIGGFEHE